MNESQIFDALVKKRGIDIDSFLNPKYKDLLDPLTLPDIEPALKRLKQAKEGREKVGVYGDYDIDGLCATTLLNDAFESFGIDSVGYIPDRFIDGYGMSKNGVDELKAQGVSLIVTVDCGSRSEEEIAYAKKQSIDVIVTDHHEIDEAPKSAIAVVNAKRSDSKYEFRDRCGGGIAFGLVQAMQKDGFEGLEDGQEKWLLDLVAMATVADIVELRGENRILLKWGLEVLKKTRRPGLLALMNVSDFKPDEADEVKIGFRIGPRLNAAGRIEHGKLALELLMSKTNAEATELSIKLDNLNSERRAMQDQIYAGAIHQAGQYLDGPVLVLSDKDWAQGVVGIVAAKVVEDTKKPAFVLQNLEDGLSKGSARSFGDFDLSEALTVVRPMLKAGGGHKYAAGVTLETKDLDKFRKALSEHHNSLKLGDQSAFLEPKGDMTLESLSGLTLELVEMLNQLAPYGEGNPPPQFEVKGVEIADFRGVGAEQKHAKLKIADNQKNIMDAIGFSLSAEVESLSSDQVDIVCRLSANTFNGRTTPQLEVLKISEASK